MTTILTTHMLAVKVRLMMEQDIEVWTGRAGSDQIRHPSGWRVWISNHGGDSPWHGVLVSPPPEETLIEVTIPTRGGWLCSRPDERDPFVAAYQLAHQWCQHNAMTHLMDQR